MSESDLMIQNIGGVTVIDFSGTAILDGTTVESLSRKLMDIVEVQAQKKLLLNFNQVKFLSSSLLGVLIKLHKVVDANHGKVAISGLKSDLFKVFQITHMDKLFEFYEDEEPGLNSFGVYTKA